MDKEKLFRRIADISNSMFPLVDFFNDIVQIKDEDYNKEQAYNDIEKICGVVEELIADNKRKVKLEKAWEITKTKRVALCKIVNSKDYLEYNQFVYEFVNEYAYELLKLTEDEFNLLKETLEEK